MDEATLTDDAMREVVSEVDAHTLRMYQQRDKQAMYKIIGALLIRVQMDADDVVSDTELLDAFDDFLQREL